MHDGKIPISNNRAEQHIRPFATHRRAWLFADTQAGARANATAYSLIETARSYELNVYEYIHYVLKRMPAAEFSFLRQASSPEKSARRLWRPFIRLEIAIVGYMEH